jgi:hypothetical protein
MAVFGDIKDIQNWGSYRSEPRIEWTWPTDPTDREAKEVLNFLNDLHPTRVKVGNSETGYYWVRFVGCELGLVAVKFDSDMMLPAGWRRYMRFRITEIHGTESPYYSVPFRVPGLGGPLRVK